MDSREILPETETIQFLLDTESLNHLSGIDYNALERFLRYSHYDNFHFLRRPGQTNKELLDEIDSYTVEKSVEENRQIIEWGEENRGVHAARYMPGIYQKWTDEVDWDEPQVSVDDLELVDLFSELLSTRPDHVDVLITANESILKNRRQLEYQIRRHKQDRLHVMTVQEASEFAGIFMRQNDDFIFYYTGSDVTSYKIDFTLWYWTIPRVFVQHYTAGEEGYLGSMLDRFDSLFLCIDKLGQQYYQGTGNHTDLRTRYHFNYGISLLTGICDVLALHTRDKYGMNIPDRRTNLRTGDYPLLKELRNHNKEAWEYVHSNHEIVELLHTVRNDIIHQSGVIKRGPGMTFREHGDTTPWESQTLWMEELYEKDREKFRKYYKEIDDQVKDYDPVTEWGIVTDSDEKPDIREYSSIEPYRFLKQATRRIAEFSDEYLRLLGHPNRVEQSEDSSPASKGDAKRIAEYGLHPFLEHVDPDSVV